MARKGGNEENIVVIVAVGDTQAIRPATRTTDLPARPDKLDNGRFVRGPNKLQEGIIKYAFLRFSSDVSLCMPIDTFQHPTAPLLLNVDLTHGHRVILIRPLLVPQE